MSTLPLHSPGALLLACALLACEGGARSAQDAGFEPSSEPAPASEFVISAGDSTFWVRSGEHGVSLRGSPLLLARADGRFYELYVTDDDRSYRDAVFVGQRLWRRDILTNDSAVVFADSSIAELARRWARENPMDLPLAPDEEDGGDPIAIASGELAVLDVVGPYVSYEWLADLHPLGEEPTHRLHRGVRDLRSGRDVRLPALVGDSAARALIAQADRAFRATADSLGLGTGLPVGFAFDPRSFALGVEGGTPVISFLVPARNGTAGELAGLPLPSLPVEPLEWWNDARSERSTPASRVVEERWSASNELDLVARYEAGGLVSLLLRGEYAGKGEDGSAGDRDRREWQVGRVTPPVQRVYWLHDPPADSSTRAALERAFNDADQYELEFPISPMPPPRFANRQGDDGPGPGAGSAGAATLAMSARWRD